MRSARALLLLVMLALAGVAAASDPAPQSDPPRSASWLGVWLGDAVDGGVQIVALVPGGPAEVGGLLPGDVLIEANGRWLAGQSDLSGVLDVVDPGDLLNLVVLRRGDQLNTDVTVGRQRFEAVPAPAPRVPRPARPGSPAPPVQSSPSPGGLGLRVAAATPGLRKYFGAPPEAGVLVTRVEAGRVAERSGIQVGDVLIRLGERTILTPAELDLVVLSWNDSQPLEAQIVRERKTRVVELSASEPSAPVSAAAEAVNAARAARERAVRLQIERLQQRLADLERELEGLRSDRD